MPKHRAGRRAARAVVLAAAAQAILLATSLPSASAAVASPASIEERTVQSSWFRRHGDHGQEEEEDEDESAHDMGPMMATSSSSSAVPMPSASSSHEHGHQEAHGSHEHGHSHDDPATAIPPATEVGPELRPMPPRKKSSGGHSHGLAHADPILELNETSVFIKHGPEPLSYIEWDRASGMGRLDQLLRFVDPAALDQAQGQTLMGAVDGRWRTLYDEPNAKSRLALEKDMRSRVGSNAKREQPGRHGSLMILHIVGCVIACFILLPVALALRAANSSLAPLFSMLYLVTLSLSLLTSMLYRAMTPKLYPSNAHSGLGWTVFWFSVICLGSDVFRLAHQIFAAVTGGREKRLNAAVRAMLGHGMESNSEKYEPLEEERMLSEGESDAQELDLENTHHHHRSVSVGSPRVHFADDRRNASVESLQEAHWVGSGSTAVGHAHAHSGRISESADRLHSPTGTLVNTPTSSAFGHAAHGSLGSIPFKLPWKLHSVSQSEHGSSSPRTQMASHQRQQQNVGAADKPRTRMQKFGTFLRYTRVTVARSLPLIAFAAAYTGLAVYTGTCRAGFKNVCLAHGIKGAIFFFYGLFTFARFVGAYADCGWAWNRRPTPSNARKNVAGWRKNMPSAEWVECLVIFIYGSTNTWMERFGVAPGSPFTVKQVQHISIAVMFWFAGLMGLLIETRWIRDLVSFPVALYHPSAAPASSRRAPRSGNNSEEEDELVAAQTAPPSYSGSFNPFPALVIGVTGIAMSAHYQEYVYEVQIHALWGNLLAGFAVLRCLTYFFLWLRPPASVLPSRPPTEALASFALTCGGLTFMLSTEEVSMNAMRNAYGDMMMIMNASVALVSLLFCWTFALLTIKGWAVRREHSREQAQGGGSIRLDMVDAHQSDAHSGEREREPRRMSAVISRSSEPVFVLDDEDENADRPARHMSDSPGPIEASI